MRSPLTSESLSRSWKFGWRVAVLLLVFTVSLCGFVGGAEVSDRDLSGADILAMVYYSVGLFVLGGLDLGVPSGGPTWAQSCVWVGYFAAPTVTASALIEGVWRILHPRTVLHRLKNHVIIGGCGRLAILYLQRLREENPRRPLVVIDSRVDNPNAQIASDRYRAYVILGDLANPVILDSLRLDRAKEVLFLTGDDYANLDAAARVAKIAPELASRTTVHVSDLRLLRTLEHSNILSAAQKFNSYRTAAIHLVRDHLEPHFRSTETPDSVVLAGFGRFGQTVLDELQRRAAGLFDRVLVMDSEANLGMTVFEDQVGVTGEYSVDKFDTDIRHPEAWACAADILATVDEPVIVVGTGNDATNIRSALWLSRKFPSAKIIARCFQSSDFTEEIAHEGHFELVSTADLLLAKLEE